MWCNPLTLQPEQSGEVGSSPSRAHHLSVMKRGHGLDLDCSISAIPALGAEKRNFTSLHFNSFISYYAESTDSFTNQLHKFDTDFTKSTYKFV